MYYLKADIVGPLLLNASLLLVLTTDYSDWLEQVDVVGPLLLNAGLLLVLTTDYSDWLVQVIELIDNWWWQSLLSFDDCVIEVKSNFKNYRNEQSLSLRHVFIKIFSVVYF